MRLKLIGLSLLAAVALARTASAQSVLAAPDKIGGVYQLGETVHWRLQVKDAVGELSAHYRFLKGGLTVIKEGDVDLSAGHAQLETQFDAPGTMLLEVTWSQADKKVERATAGAVAAPESIALSASRPADFSVFWAAKLHELAAVPADPRLEVIDLGKANVTYAKIKLGNIRGTHIQGQLARPSQGEKFPALLIVQWAGVYGLQPSWVTDHAANGWLVLNIEPHDLPIDQPEAFYKEQASTGPLHDYWSIGNDDRETSYYLRMYLSCYRAAEYLTSREDWDGQTLVVMGGSQGGMQSLMTAAIFPKVTTALAIVPAGCDMLGPVVGRKGGWPHWYANTDGKSAAKVHEASRYFDVANFAPEIKCPVLVGVGLLDETCPPAGIFAAFNQITAPKELIILPKSGHQGDNGVQRPYEERRDNAWLPALVKGQAAPVAYQPVTK